MIHVVNSLFLFFPDNLILPGLIFIFFLALAYFVDSYSRKTIFRFKTKDNLPLRIPILLFVISLGVNLIIYLNASLFSTQIIYIKSTFQIFCKMRKENTSIFLLTDESANDDLEIRLRSIAAINTVKI